MKVRLKLYAALGQYLPAGAENNEVDFEVADGASPTDVIAALNLPQEMCHLVLVNGLYVAPSERDTKALEDGDAIAMWPPVAGG